MLVGTTSCDQSMIEHLIQMTMAKQMDQTVEIRYGFVRQMT